MFAMVFQIKIQKNNKIVYNKCGILYYICCIVCCFCSIVYNICGKSIWKARHQDEILQDNQTIPKIVWCTHPQTGPAMILLLANGYKCEGEEDKGAGVIPEPGVGGLGKS